MTPELLLQVVSTLIQPMSQGQRYEVLGRITALVMSGHGPVIASPGQPGYQPQAGYEASQVPATQAGLPPAPVQPSGKIMINKGWECVCDGCNAVVYKVQNDVRENMGKKDFVACFMPRNGAPELRMPLDAWADTAGNLAIDCPLCKGEKSLWIKGKGDLPFRDVPQGDDSGRADTGGGAGTI